MFVQLNRIAFSCLSIVLLLLAQSASAISLLRDDEIESTIRLYAMPVWKVAGLDASAVKVHLVNDPSLNAFVAGGQRIFINSGLLVRANSPDEVIGVLAHETGHIAGGHLARTQDVLSKASTTAILTYLMGAAAMAAGQAQAGAAIMASAQDFAGRQFLSYSRSQEAGADQFAIRMLRATGQSPKGLRDFMNILAAQEASSSIRQSLYYRSHPLSRSRVDTLDRAILDSPFAGVPTRPELVKLHARIKAKLQGFLYRPESTFGRYPRSDTSIPARYARAIAHHQQASTKKALAEIDLLIAAEPENAYFHELKGQILFESGFVEKSLAPYRRAVALLPNAPLIRVALGQGLVASKDSSLYPEAIRNLDMALRQDSENSQAWHQLSLAYGKTDQIGMATLATAERYLRIGMVMDARTQADRAMGRLEEDTPSWNRARDIMEIIEAHNPQVANGGGRGRGPGR